jgi:hypothetical protein
VAKISVGKKTGQLVNPLATDIEFIFVPPIINFSHGDRFTLHGTNG